MNTMPHPEIIGLDVSRDWLGIHCLTDSRQLRLPNTDEGHSELESIAGDRNALVCFEAAGGCEWRLWASLEAAGIPARQLPPAQVKAFGRSRGASAKTDRIDAELIACFMAFRPEAGRRLPSGKLRDLRTPATARRQLVEMRKNVQLQNKASLKSGTADRESAGPRISRKIMFTRCSGRHASLNIGCRRLHPLPTPSTSRGT